MNMEDILDALDALIDNAWSLPLSGGRCMVDADKVRDLIDDIRMNMPTEITKAKEIVSDRASILANARREGETIVKRAEERARSLVARDEIVRLAQERANELMIQTQTQARQVKAAANEFAMSLLDNTEKVLSQAFDEVKTTKIALKNQRSK